MRYTKILTPESRILTPDSWILNPESWLLTPQNLRLCTSQLWELLYCLQSIASKDYSYNDWFWSRWRILIFFLRKNQLLKMFSIVVSTMKVFRKNILGNVKIYKSIWRCAECRPITKDKFDRTGDLGCIRNGKNMHISRSLPIRKKFGWLIGNFPASVFSRNLIYVLWIVARSKSIRLHFSR